VSVRKMKAVTVKMETVKEKHFSAEVLFLGFVLCWGRYIFPRQTYFSGEMSQSSCIPVNKVVQSNPGTL